MKLDKMLFMTLSIQKYSSKVFKMTKRAIQKTGCTKRAVYLRTWQHQCIQLPNSCLFNHNLQWIDTAAAIWKGLGTKMTATWIYRGSISRLRPIAFINLQELLDLYLLQRHVTSLQRTLKCSTFFIQIAISFCIQMLHLKCHEYSETCRIPRTIARFTYGSFTWTAKFRTALLKIEGQVVIKHEMKTNCLGRRGSRYAESISGLYLLLFIYPFPAGRCGS